MMFDSSLLREYIDTFYGYGDYKARYWLIGMEEGGGGSFQEITRHISKWVGQSKGEVLDLRWHHTDADPANSIPGSEKLQATWSQLIRVVLAIQGKPTDNQSVSDYQQAKLGRSGGDTCLLELMPLPSPDSKTWLYREHSLLRQLRSRDDYMKHYAQSRALGLRGRIAEHKPAVVVFYSLSYFGWWKQIAGVEFTRIPVNGVRTLFGRNEHTHFVVVPQPAAQMKGKGTGYYVQVGKAIATSLQTPSPNNVK
jgi:hypothetical protein